MRVARWALGLVMAIVLAASFGGVGRAANPVTAGTPGQVIVEPQAGATPYVRAIAAARHAVDVEAYIITDREIVQALKDVAARAVTVRVIVAGNPYDDSSAVKQERAEFAGSRVQVRLAPAQFERPYVYDHAKFLVIDPGTSSGVGILGSSNLDYSGLGGGNREYDWRTTQGATVSALATVFQADWGGRPTPVEASRVLVLSPGSETAIVSLISSAKHSVDIETEEFGDVPAVMSALEADLHRHVTVRIVVPTSLSRWDMRQVDTLVGDGGRAIGLRSPYPHSKLIVVDGHVAFLGSENFSTSSFLENREVGIEVQGPQVTLLERQFNLDFGSQGG